MLVIWISFIDVLQKLDFVQTLIKVVLVVLHQRHTVGVLKQGL